MTRLRVALCAALALVLLAATARADVTVDLDLGHGSRWVADCLAPASVTLRNDGQVAVTVRLRLSQDQSMASPPVRLERSVFVGPGATRREWFLLPAPDPWASGMKLRVETDPSVPVHHGGDSASRGIMTVDVQQTMQSANTVLSGEGRAIGVIGDESSVLAAVLPNAMRDDLIELSGELAAIGVAGIEEDALTLAPFVLEGFDSIVVVDPPPGMLADPAALEGVLDWVALGGLLVVSPGSNAGNLGASPLAPYVAPRAGAPEQRDMAAVVLSLPLEKPAGTDGTVVDPLPFRGTWLPLEGLADDRPYVDRRFGHGRIRTLAFDARAALRACRDQAHLAVVAEILAGRGEPVRDRGLADALRALRFDMTTDIDESMTRVSRRDAFEPPPFIVILASLILYVLLVGPVDWIVLRRLGKQRLTTFTFGGAVIVFTAVAYGASFLLFSSGSMVNRVVFVDLADGGRDGRQLIRVQDVVAYYSPRGADLSLTYPLPATLEGVPLPGGRSGEVGTAEPILGRGSDPRGQELLIQVAFKSQRVARSRCIGTTGRTIEASWVSREDGAAPALRLVNGLPVALRRVDVLLPDAGAYHFSAIEAGGEAVAERTKSRAGVLGSGWGGGSRLLAKDFADADALDFMAFLTRCSQHGWDGRSMKEMPSQPLGLGRQARLARTGIGLGAALHDGHALLLAVPEEPPVTLPASEFDGAKHVLIRKEIDIP